MESLYWCVSSLHNLCVLLTMNLPGCVLPLPQHKYHWFLLHQPEVPPYRDKRGPLGSQVLSARKKTTHSPAPDRRAGYRSVGAQIPDYTLPEILEQGLRTRS